MGTELVPFKNWSEFSAAHKNMRQKSQQLNRRFSVVVFGGAAVTIVALTLIGQISSNLAFICSLIVGALFVYERVGGKRGVRRNQVADLANVAIEFPCPHCFENYNLGHSWVCGWCKEIHNDWLPTGEMPTPVSGCNNTTCQETKVHGLARGQGDQAAVQCPNCARHIVIDPVLYEKSQCHLSPFSGVARFSGDTAEPNRPAPIRSVYPTAPGSPNSSKTAQKQKKSWFNDV